MESFQQRLQQPFHLLVRLSLCVLILIHDVLHHHHRGHHDHHGRPNDLPQQAHLRQHVEPSAHFSEN